MVVKSIIIVLSLSIEDNDSNTAVIPVVRGKSTFLKTGRFVSFEYFCDLAKLRKLIVVPSGNIIGIG